jgi:probable F420-dependent oxidoreductase
MSSKERTARDQSLEFGILIQSMGDDASPETLTRLATAAETAGSDCIWAGDHVTFPVEMSDTYPFSSSGEPPAAFHAEQTLLEVFGSLSFVAAKTGSIRIGTNVCLPPLRHPVLLTKQALTLEELSKGRLELGVAAGWLPEEYEVMGVPWSERGERLDEFLDIFTRARREGVLAYDGPHTQFSESGFHPIPTEENRPPIWIGGMSGAAFRRVAEFGSGWTIVRDRPREVAAGRERLLRAWEDYDRSGTPEVAVSRPVHVGDDPPFSSDRILVGEPEEIIADLEDYVAAGTTHFVANFFTMDVDEQVEQIERLGAEVIPAFET